MPIRVFLLVLSEKPTISYPSHKFNRISEFSLPVKTALPFLYVFPESSKLMNVYGTVPATVKYESHDAHLEQSVDNSANEINSLT